MDLNKFSRAYNRASIFMLVCGVANLCSVYIASRPESLDSFINANSGTVFTWGGVVLWMVVVKAIIFATKKGWTI